MHNRASILSRPIRPAHPSSGESAEREYQQEQARLQARRERYNATQDFVRTMMNPSGAEKRSFQAEMSDSMSMQLEERRQREREIRAKDISEPHTCPLFLAGGDGDARAGAAGPSAAQGRAEQPPRQAGGPATSVESDSHHYHHLIQHRRLDAPRPGSARSRAMAREMLEENKRLAAMRAMEKANARREELASAREAAAAWDNSSQFYR